MLDSEEARLNLDALRPDSRPGMQARIQAAVLAHVEKPESRFDEAVGELERIRWPALAAAAVLVLLSAIVPGSRSAQMGSVGPGIASAIGIPTEWAQLIQTDLAADGAPPIEDAGRSR